ncbi:CAAX prenyl protease-related protein [Duganella sp. P38]|uniref:CAAX prenyl protease-related protein n=1 Tax=Duganella sp. P38 TaxID=3423949 RepID=UPI003D797B12
MFDASARPRVLPFLAYMLFIVLADLLQRSGLDEAQLRYVYPVKIAVVAAMLWHYRHAYVELATPMNLGQGLLSVAVGVLVLVLWVNLDAGWMVIGQSAGYDPRDNGVVNWPLAMIRLAGAALVVPVMEELFWRSFLARWLQSANFLELRPIAIKLRFLVVTVILFGFEHNLWFAGIIAGIAYTLLYCRTGSLRTAVLAHAVTNGLLGVWIICTAQWTYW